MKLLEIYSDAAGESHFRETEVAFDLRNFAPPSQPIGVSAEIDTTTAVFLAAPPGWDPDPHPTPRQQIAILLAGEAIVTASGGDTRRLTPGGAIFLNDTQGKGHTTIVQGEQNAHFLLVGGDRWA